MTRTIDEVDADLQDTKTKVVDLESLITSFDASCWAPEATGAAPTQSRSKSFRMSIFAAPKACRILSISCVWEYMNLATSETVYWKGDVGIGSGPAGWTTVATKTTQSATGTANGPIVSRKVWKFDSANWADHDLNLDEILSINWSPVGGPAPFTFPFHAQIRYRPL